MNQGLSFSQKLIEKENIEADIKFHQEEVETLLDQCVDLEIELAEVALAKDKEKVKECLKKLFNISRKRDQTIGSIRSAKEELKKLLQS